MGISNPMLAWLTDLHARGAFTGLRSILELGPQDLVLNRRILADCLARIAGRPVSVEPFYNGAVPNPVAARALYREMGVSEYFSIDLEDARADYHFNLNDATTLPRKFDIITDFGTAEHIFNVGNVVSLIHNHLPIGGLALHVLPTRGDYNHGFYNFHSTWFRDLAAANGYEIVDMVCVPNFGDQHHDMDKAASAGRHYQTKFIDVAAGDDQAVGDERFAFAAFARYARRRLKPSTDPRIYEYIFAALRKTADAPFAIRNRTITVGQKMTAIVSIEQYDEEEAAAKCDVSYVEMMAFATTTFAIFGFPAIVAREQELARYVDWNNSPSNEQYFRPDYFVRGPSVETSFTPRERQIVETVSDSVAALTARYYGREMRPISTLLSQFGLFRVIMALQAQADRPITVFEVGPGNGYLGAMLVAAGINYIGFDNAQALYLWQNRLLAECAGDAFYDWIGGGPSAPSGVRVQHLPWWHYLRLRKDCPIGADIVVSNTNLGEMNYGALKFTSRIARVILNESSLAAFLFTNIGDSKQNTMAAVEGELAAAGFRNVCKDLLYAYVPEGAGSMAALRELDVRIPLYNPDYATQRFQAREILKLRPNNLPSDMDFLGFIGTFAVPGERDFEIREAHDPSKESPIVRAAPLRETRSPSEPTGTIDYRAQQGSLPHLARQLLRKYSRYRSG